MCVCVCVCVCRVCTAGITSSKHPRIVPALIMLGYVFSRTARVTYAEGLYREAAKILQVCVYVHAYVCACVCVCRRLP